MKTTIISLCAGMGSAITDIRKNGIKYSLLDFDHNGKLLVQLHYNDEQQEAIDDLSNFLNEVEKTTKEFNDVFLPLLKKMQDEEEQRWQNKLKELGIGKYKLNNSASKEGTDGNKKGE